MKRNITTIETARLLRKKSTKAEKILWNELRNRKFNGLKFRRQQPMDRYVVDFYCFEKKLIVEIDGEIHNHIEQMEYDLIRETALENSRNNIIRIDNKDVIEDVKSVLLKIQKYIEHI